MKVGDLVKVQPWHQRLRWIATAPPEQVGLVVGTDRYDNPVVSVDGVIKSYHRSHVVVVINEA